MAGHLSGCLTYIIDFWSAHTIKFCYPQHPHYGTYLVFFLVQSSFSINIHHQQLWNPEFLVAVGLWCLMVNIMVLPPLLLLSFKNQGFRGMTAQEKAKCVGVEDNKSVSRPKINQTTAEMPSHFSLSFKFISCIIIVLDWFSTGSIFLSQPVK